MINKHTDDIIKTSEKYSLGNKLNTQKQQTSK